jgi:PleD family two-component response regulator
MVIAIAQKLCQLIGAGFLEHENLPVHFSVSCGATLIKNQEEMNEAIHRADELMYRAKRNGKNQVCADFE